MGILDDKFFTLRKEHIALLNRSIVNWQHDEFGAPEIDPKRPYGNSEVLDDIREIIGDAVGEWDYEQLDKLHKETATALQVILSTRSFQTGLYQSDWAGREWRLVKETEC